MAGIIAATFILPLTLYGAWHLTGVAYGYFFSVGDGGSAKDAGSLWPRYCAELRRKLIAAQREAAGDKRRALLDALRRTVEIHSLRSDACRLKRLVRHRGADLSGFLALEERSYRP